MTATLSNFGYFFRPTIDKNSAIRQRMKESQSKTVPQSLVSAEKENVPKAQSSSHETTSPFVSCYASGVDESSFHTADGKSILSNLMSPVSGNNNESQNQSYWAMVGQYSLVHSNNKESSNHQIMNDSLISMSPADKSSRTWSWQSSLLPDTSISPIKSMTPQKTGTPALSEDPTRYLEEWENEAVSDPQAIVEVVSNSQDDSDVVSDALNVSDVLSPVSGPTLLATKQYLEKIQKLELELRATKRKVDEEMLRRNKIEPGELDLSQSLDNAASSSHQRLVDRNKTLAKEVRFADQTCVELSGKNSALEREIAVLREQLDHLRSRNDALQEKTAESQAQSQQLQQKVADLESICSKNELEVARLKDEKEKTNEDLNKAKADAASWEFQCQFVKDQLNERNENAGVHTNHRAESQAQLAIVTEERNALRASAQQVEKYVADLEGERNQLQREKLELTTMKEVHCAEIDSLTTLLTSTREQLGTAQNETSDARKQVERLSKELALRETQHNKRLAEYDTELSRLQMNASSKEQSMEQQKNEVRSYQEQIRLRNEEFAQLETHITKVLEEKRDVELLLEESRSVVARQESQLAVARDSLEQNERKLKKVVDLLAKADQRADEALRKLMEGVKNVFDKTDRMEAVFGNQASQLHDRLCNLNMLLKFISNAIDFDNESSVASHLSRGKEDEFEMGDVSRSLALNATLNLEKMEEARTSFYVQHAMSADIVESPCLSTGERAELSSIHDASQFFSDGASKSSSEEELQLEKNAPSCLPVTPSVKEIKGSDRFQIKSFFDNETDLFPGELHDLRIKMQKYRDERNSLLEKHELLGKEKAALEATLETRTRELNFELKHSTSLTQVVDDLTRKQKDADEYVTKVKQEKEEIAQKLQMVEDELLMEQERITDLVKDVHKLLQRQGESSHYSAELQEILLLTEAEKKKYKKSMSLFCKQTAQAVNTIHELEHRIQEGDNASGNMETYRTRLILLDSRLRETEAKLHLSEECCSALREQNLSYQQDLNSLMEEKNAIVQDRNNCLSELSTLSKDLEIVTKNSRELNSRLDTCTAKLLVKDDELRKLQEELLRSNAELEEFKESFSKNSSELFCVSRRQTEIEAITKPMKDEYENRLSESHQEHQEEIERLVSEKNLLINESSDLKAQLNQQEIKRGEVELRLDQVSKDLEYAKKELAERDVELQSTKVSLDEATTCVMGLKSSFLACNERLASLTAAHTESVVELERYRNLLESADDLESAATARFLDAQSKLEQVQEERDSLQLEYQAMVEKLRDIEEYYTKLEAIASKKSEKEEKKRIQEIKRLQEVLEITRAELESRDARIKQLVQEVRNLESTLSTMKTKQVEADSTAKKLCAASKELATIKDELDIVRRDASDKSRQLQDFAGIKASLELKVRRLRDHIREQGKKIIRWEEFHEKRMQFLDKIRESNMRTRESAAKLAQFYSERDQVSLDE
jgi:chromosome segregation ATPase